MKNATRLLVPLLAALVAGCSDSTGTTSITDARAQAMASALFAMTRNAGTAASQAPQASSANGPLPAAVQSHVQLDVPCALGGTVGFDANVTASADSTSLSVSYGVVETPQACMARDEDSGMTFVFDGAPSLTADYVLYSNLQDSLTLNGTFGGAVDWATDGASGTCSVDMAFEGLWSAADSIGTASLQGSVCNVQVNTTVSS